METILCYFLMRKRKTFYMSYYSQYDFYKQSVIYFVYKTHSESNKIELLYFTVCLFL